MVSNSSKAGKDKVDNVLISPENIVLGYSGSDLVTQGATRHGVLSTNDTAFKVYYANPTTVFYIQNDITVTNGTVSTLDGPLMLTAGRKITVKDGGVLSVDGWMINNGSIEVEPGGTLLVQKGATITTMRSELGTEAGEITINGNAIVMSGGALTCGGTEGLKVGASAQVLNYGVLAAENMKIAGTNTVENRGKNSYIFPGWTYTDSGIGLMQYSLDGGVLTRGSYRGMGTVEKTRGVDIKPGAIFGEGSSRVYTYPSKQG